MSLIDFINNTNRGNGACLKFVIAIWLCFDVKMYYNSDHVVVKYNDSYYDAHGEVFGNYLDADLFGARCFVAVFNEYLTTEEKDIICIMIKE